MGKFMWILGATSLGVAVYVFLNGQAGTGSQPADGVDNLSARVGGWGTKNRVTGTGDVLGGKLKQGFGDITGDNKIKGEGAVDETVGRVKDAAGQAANAVSNAVSNLNR